MEEGGYKDGTEVLELVLPWLSPPHLALLARACSRLARAAAAISRQRQADAAQGLERFPVPILNSLDSCLYPYFRYAPFCLPSSTLAFPQRSFAWPSALTIAHYQAIHDHETRENLRLFDGLQAGGCACSVCGSNDSETRVSDCEGDAQETEATQCVDHELLNPPISLLDAIGLEKSSHTWFSGKEGSGPRGNIDRLAETTNNDVDVAAFQTSGCPCGCTIEGELAFDKDSRLQILVRDRISAHSQEQHDQFMGDIRLCLQQGRLSEERKPWTSEDDTNSHTMPTSVPYSHEEGPPLIFECGVLCRCSSSCRYRVLQHGLAVPVIIKRHRFKGWGLHAQKPILQGTFICEYSGELVTTEESRRRQKIYDAFHSGKSNWAPALLVLREHLPSRKSSMRVNIDATKMGNVARFINHSCDGGNLLPCLVRSAGSFFPRLGLFARRNIQEMEELTFSYGSIVDGSQLRPCFCDTWSCKGFLPSEET